MSSPKSYSLADVRRSYTSDKAWAEMTGELPLFLLYRPLSFPVAYLCLRAGIPSVLVTLSGLLLAAMMLVAAVSGGQHAYLWVATCGIGAHILDCVDGNIARTQHRATRFGAVLDGCVDSTFSAALFAALGLLVEREGAAWFSGFGLEIGLASTLVVMLNRKVRDHYAQLSGRAAVLGEPRIATPTLRQWALYAFVGLENLYAPLLLFFGATHAVHWLLLFAASYALGISCAAIAITLRKAREDDRARRPNAPDCG